MKKSRKHISNLLSKVKSLKTKYEHLYKDIDYIISQEEYEQTIKNYDRIIERLNEELLVLPVGFRYQGTFYIKNSYTIPATFEKHDGVVYMREDLISWQIEQGLERPDNSYHRNIYKEPKDSAELKKEDAEPVYIST
jgi:hypothetical protein